MVGSLLSRTRLSGMATPFSFKLHHVDRGCALEDPALPRRMEWLNFPRLCQWEHKAPLKDLPFRKCERPGAQIVLGNTYHLALRPGEDVVSDLGGLHRFMGWDGPILTDSGGFQVFSLAESTKVTEQSAVFQSHIDGKKLELSPERSIEIQEALGSDIAMVLDHVIALPASDEDVLDACERTIRWAQRCLKARSRSDQRNLRSFRADCRENFASLARNNSLRSPNSRVTRSAD